jgi:hypothetical protein
MATRQAPVGCHKQGAANRRLSGRAFLLGSLDITSFMGAPGEAQHRDCARLRARVSLLLKKMLLLSLPAALARPSDGRLHL